MKIITRRIIYILLILMPVYKTQSVMALEGPTMDETISYLEAEIPEATGIKASFTLQILDKQIEGAKQENYKLKIVNRELIVIEKDNVKIAKNMEGNQSLVTSQRKITEVITLENLNPKITLIYKTTPSESNDALKVIYPPHIKIKIKAKLTKKWKMYNSDIEQVTAMLNQTGRRFPKPDYETESCLLLTTDETSAEKIAKSLSHLILLCGGIEDKGILF